MGDVVAEFHVLDGLRHDQSERAGGPAGLAAATEDGQTRRDLEGSLKVDGALDVGAIISTQGGFDITANGIELAGNLFDVRVVQMCVFGYLGDGDAASHPIAME
jgi:hypothetical protein